MNTDEHRWDEQNDGQNRLMEQQNDNDTGERYPIRVHPCASVVESCPETEVYTAMQARLIALLLRHDIQRFRNAIGPHSAYAAQPEDPALHHYRELAVLFHLRDELFEHILPRIVRRLSFETPRNTVVEEPPARGRIDWERTLRASWQERPDQPPLALHTHQRHRDFATPENLLTVATLLDYRADIEHVLQHEYLTSGSNALRHPLTAIIEHCERELAFPQFATLRQSVQHWRELASDEDIATLEQQVRERFIPGGNSAYEELLTWREQRRNLHLLQRTPQPHEPSAVLGADPQRDNYLYQLWIFYELVELLQQTGNLEAVDPTKGQMRITFWWGSDDTRCRYELRHDQAVPQPVAQWISSLMAGDVPGVRPDFLLRRIDPPAQHVTQAGSIIWREPGLIWDAKYYRERESPRTPASPIKRMLADLTLLGETCGILLFAFLDEPTTPHAPSLHARLLTPSVGQDQTIIPTLEIQSHQMQPSREAGTPHVTDMLHHLLNDMHERLHQPRTPRCHGIFLDSLSVAEHPPLCTRHAEPVASQPEDLLICPKPHIGPWRVDLVSRQHHCCQDAHLCHIIDQPDSKPPVRPPRTAEDLLKELQHLFAQHTEPPDEELVQIIATQVEHLTRRFADIVGVYRNIEIYTQRVIDLGMRRTWHMLPAEAQESLALAVFLVEQLDSIGASDYSAPAIHVSSVMERENQRHIFACPNLTGDATNPKRQTLGALPFLRRAWKENIPDTEEAQQNWQHISQCAETRWHGAIDEDNDNPDDHIQFDDYVKQLQTIAQFRNAAAHTNPLPRQKYAQLFEIVCQRGRLRIGALNALLLAWHPPEQPPDRD